MGKLIITDTRNYREKNYVQFGKFILNHTRLNKENILLIKYPNSYAPCPQILRTKISDEFKMLINDLIDTGEINVDLQKRLSDNKESFLFELLLKKANLAEQLNYKKLSMNIADYKTRFRLLQGAMNAGNNSKEIVDECIIITNKLHDAGEIIDSDYNMLINSLT